MPDKPKAIRINLGCGFDHRPGFFNVDVDPRVKPDIIHDLYQPLPFTPNTVDEILLQDVLEHFTKEDGLRLLKECQRILKQGGVLTIRMPNVYAIFQKYQRQPDLLFLFLYGDTHRNGVWGAHKFGYTRETLIDALAEMSLNLEQALVEDTNFVFICRKIKRQKSRYRVFTQPELLQSSSTFDSGICNSLAAMVVVTPQLIAARKKCLWAIGKPPSRIIGKILLRPLSTFVSQIIVTSPAGDEFCRTILKYSHLKIKRQTHYIT